MTHSPLLRILFLASLLLFAGKLNMAADFDFSGRLISVNTHQKDHSGKTSEPFNPITLPSDDGGHHEHEDGHYCKFHFDRIRRRSRISRVIVAFVYALLIFLHSGIIAYQTYHLMHSVDATAKILEKVQVPSNV